MARRAASCPVSEENLPPRPEEAGRRPSGAPGYSPVPGISPGLRRAVYTIQLRNTRAMSLFRLMKNPLVAGKFPTDVRTSIVKYN